MIQRKHKEIQSDELQEKVTLTQGIISKTHSAYNAQLRGEQRLHPNLKYCAINTKIEVEAKVPSVVNPS